MNNMLKGRMLYSTKINGYKTNGKDIELGVYGLFQTDKVRWTYHVISFYTDNGGSIRLTDDICGRFLDATYDSIRSYGKQFDTKELGQKFIEEYKCKWETGSNDTTQEMRDKKIGEILDEK